MFIFEKPKATVERQEIKPGKYLGKIAKGEIGSTKAGHKTIKLRLKLEGVPGFHFVDLNMEHEKTKAISHQTISSILFGALSSPPASLATLQEICDFLTDLPVHVTIKERVVNGEARLNTYFNDCPQKLTSKVPSKSNATISW